MGRKRMPIGKFLVSRGLLSIEQEHMVAEVQSKMKNSSVEPFGRLAVKMGFLTSGQIRSALKERTPVH